MTTDRTDVQTPPRGMRRAIAINATLFIAALLFGAVAYANRIGSFGDAMNMFKADADRYPSAFAFIRFWYTTANGRLGGFISDAAFQRIAAYGPFTPDTYPWWLLCSVSLFGALAAPVNLGIACARLLGHARFPIAAFVAIAWALWVAQPVLIETSFLGQAVGEYFLAFYLFSLALLALTEALETGSRGWFAASGVLYLYASVSYEQVLAAAPFVFCAATLLSSQRSGRRRTGLLLAWCGLTLVAGAVLLLSPGQRIRSGIVGAQAIPSVAVIIAWITEAIARPYGFLLHWIPRPLLWSVPVHAMLLIVALVLTLHRSEEWLLGLGFFLGSLVSTAHLLLASYAPERAAIFPALLLLTGLMIVSGRFPKRAPRGIWTVLVAALVVAGVLNVHASAGALHRTAWLSSIRTDAYHRVLADHARTGTAAYQLTDCPPGFDAPWGTAAYFAWEGYPIVDVQLEGRDALSRGKSTIVACRVPPLRPARLMPSAAPAQVRALLSLSADNRGIARYDYWVPATADTCDVIASANPNVAGSPEYRDTVRYQLAFTNQWDYAANRVARAIAARETVSAASGGTRVGVVVAWNGAEVTNAPLANWPATPGLLTDQSALVRVIIDHPSPGYLGDYDRVSLSCR